jgi:hypothetical protein
MRKKGLLILALLLTPATSLATPPTIATSADATMAEPEKYSDRRTEVDLGMLTGGSDIGETNRFTYGLHLNIGRRFGDLALLGEYDYLSIGRQDSASQGSLSRLGVTARYSLLRTSGKLGKYGKRGPLSGDYWFEAGAGMQRLAWDAGGTLTRPDLVFGVGLQFNVLIDRRAEKPRYFGPYVAFRANVARAPESSLDVPATCGGPCDTQTSPPGNDVSAFFHFGVNWAR